MLDVEDLGQTIGRFALARAEVRHLVADGIIARNLTASGPLQIAP